MDDAIFVYWTDLDLTTCVEAGTCDISFSKIDSEDSLYFDTWVVTWSSIPYYDRPDCLSPRSRQSCSQMAKSRCSTRPSINRVRLLTHLSLSASRTLPDTMVFRSLSVTCLSLAAVLRSVSQLAAVRPARTTATTLIWNVHMPHAPNSRTTIQSAGLTRTSIKVR